MGSIPISSTSTKIAFGAEIRQYVSIFRSRRVGHVLVDLGGRFSGMSETEDYVALTRLQSAYADVISRRAWSELDPLFMPQALVRIDTVTREAFELVGPAALGEFISTAVQRFEFFEFVILNSRCSLYTDGQADKAAARIFMCEVRRDVDTGDWSTAYGVYHDRYQRVDGTWLFERRDYQSLTRTDGPVFPFPHHLGID